MTFEEKYAAQGRKLDELKAKIEETVDARKAAREEAREQTREQIAAQLDAMDAKLDAQADAFDAKLDAQAEKISDKMDKAEERAEAQAAKVKAAFTLDQATAESIANEPTRIDEFQKYTAGDFAAAAENARLFCARRDAKFSNARLRTEMKVNAAKEKVSERKEAFDKAEQEDWILYLLDYAEGCYEMAYNWALEAEYTLMEAAYEIDYYNEKFGEKE